MQYLNGTATFQCVEQTAKGIICPNYWMTFGCEAGYVCNEDTGTCEQVGACSISSFVLRVVMCTLPGWCMIDIIVHLWFHFVPDRAGRGRQA